MNEIRILQTEVSFVVVVVVGVGIIIFNEYAVFIASAQRTNI